MRGVKEAMLTGRGRVVMRAKTEIETLPNGRECIVVTEIPYMVNKAKLIEKIAEMVHEKTVEGISDIRDGVPSGAVSRRSELQRHSAGECRKSCADQR